MLLNLSRVEIIRGDKMPFSKITNAQLNSKGATTLPNQPTISATALKQAFDAPAKEIVAPAFNNLIDELAIASAAADIGATPPTGRTGATVQAVINSVSADLATVEQEVQTAIADAHTHPNLDLINTYTQSDSDISDAIAKKHAHSNKELLDSYTQTDSDIADAIAKKHTHGNKSLLDSYTQSNSDLTDAVAKKHAHSNKTVLDDLSDNSGDLYYKGNPISGGGGGNVNDAYKSIVSGGQTFTASGEDTFKINAGSNVTITALSGEKGIQISASGGGGQSTGDMLMSDYDNGGNVKTAGGIPAYVTSAIGQLDGAVTGSAAASKTLTAFSETNGVVTATFGDIAISKTQVTDLPLIPTSLADLSEDTDHQTVTASQKSTWNAKASTATATTSDAGLMSATDKTKLDGIQAGAEVNVQADWNQSNSSADDFIKNKPTVPTVTDTYSSSSTDAMSGIAVASAIQNKSNRSELDEWFETQVSTDGKVQSNGTVTFSGIDDSAGTNGYKCFCERPNVSVTNTSESGTASNLTIVYTLSGAQTGDNCYLRIFK